jgi:molybdopterin biosynthesis enzyme MoaB
VRILVEGDNVKDREEVVKILREVCSGAEIVQRDKQPLIGICVGTIGGEKFDLYVFVGATGVTRSDTDVFPFREWR